MQLRAGSVEVADNGAHTGLVAHGSREVDGLLGVILGEATIVVSVRSNEGGGVVNYLLTLPLWRAARFRGKKARDPWRGASNFL